MITLLYPAMPKTFIFQESFPLKDLNNDVMTVVMAKLRNPKDKLNLSASCLRFHPIVDDKDVWTEPIRIAIVHNGQRTSTMVIS